MALLNSTALYTFLQYSDAPSKAGYLNRDLGWVRVYKRNEVVASHHCSSGYEDPFFLPSPDLQPYTNPKDSSFHFIFHYPYIPPLYPKNPKNLLENGTPT